MTKVWIQPTALDLEPRSGANSIGVAKVRIELRHVRLSMVQPNAGHHLPAESVRRRFSEGEVILRWRVRCMAMFEGVASTLVKVAGLRISSRAQATSASCLTLALSFKPRAETTFKMVSKLGLRSPDKAL